MLFFLVTSDYNTQELNTIRAKFSSTTGNLEILEQHQDLMGLITNDAVEIETNSENKTEKSLFFLQMGIFVISTKGLEKNKKGTSIYVYASKAKKITPTTSVEEVTKELENKRLELESEKKKTGKLVASPTKLNRLEKEILFCEKVVAFVKNQKGKK